MSDLLSHRSNITSMASASRADLILADALVAVIDRLESSVVSRKEPDVVLREEGIALLVEGKRKDIRSLTKLEIQQLIGILLDIDKRKLP